MICKTENDFKKLLFRKQYKIKMAAAIAFFIKEIDKKSVIFRQTNIVKKATFNLSLIIGRLLAEFKCL